MDRGLRLKELRESKRMSQTDAARHIGVSKQTLYKYENNIITNIPSDIIERIAVLYETTPGYIMGWDETAPEKIEKDNEFMELYNSADPDLQQAVVNLLKAAKHNS